MQSLRDTNSGLVLKPEGWSLETREFSRIYGPEKVKQIKVSVIYTFYLFLMVFLSISLAL